MELTKEYFEYYLDKTLDEKLEQKLEAKLEQKLERKLRHSATKDDIFLLRSEFRSEMERFTTKKDLEHFATKKDLAQFVTKKDLKQFATKKDLERFATKDDLTEEIGKLARFIADTIAAPLQTYMKRTDRLENDMRHIKKALTLT